MDPTKLTKLLKHLTYLDVQWVVEWWHIEAMSSCGFNEKCVPLVRLRRYSTILHVVLCGNSVTVKGFLVVMVLFIA